MAGEEWARRILQKELKRDVVVNDDGSKPGMYDLRIGPADAPEVAVECVAAVDPILTGTHKGRASIYRLGDRILGQRTRGSERD